MKRTADGQLRSNSSLRILQEMEGTFSLDDLVAEYESRGFQGNAAKVAVIRWKKKGIAKSDDDINFEKVK